MPDNSTTGMLENFISMLIPSGDKLRTIVDSTLKDIENKKLNHYSTTHRAKAFIHTWLAWQEYPGTPMGLSITKRYLTTDNNTCRLFLNWLENLFAVRSREPFVN